MQNSVQKSEPNQTKFKESRIGRRPITVPAGVTVNVSGHTLNVKGKLGALKQDFLKDVSIAVTGQEVKVEALSKNNKGRALQGLYRALLQNMVTGVNEGFKKTLIVKGLGYKAAPEGQGIKFALGYSHPIQFDLPKGIQVEIEKGKGNEFPLIIKGCDRQLVGQIAANIRQLRKPEVYKGTGIRYENEVIKIKQGKKAGK